MPSFTLRGPGKLGATEIDEPGLTERVVERYASVPEDVAKVDGPRLAAMVLPARRALWRLAEQVIPSQLAAALRARLATGDQTGRGGVRELREALADWLDPPLRCRRCARAIRPGTEHEPCKVQPSPTPRLHPRRRSPTPTHVLTCKARPGRAYATRGDGVSRDFRGRPVDALTIPLFTPVQLDPGCAAAAKMIRHGGATAYDLAVDRDCRVLLAALPSPPATATYNPHAVPLLPGRPRPLTRDDDRRERALNAARRRFDRALSEAIRHNGRLVLGVQARYFSPKGGVTRADLLQGGANGLRRALLDYDPKVAKISTYAINWIYQGMGEVFSGRDTVEVPDWARRMRAAVEDLGVDPPSLLALLDVLPEAWGLREDPDGKAPPTLYPWALAAACYDLAAAVLPGVIAAHRKVLAAEAARAAAEAGTDDPMVSADQPTDHSLAHLFFRAAVGPSSKPRPAERAERARERVALAVAQSLGLGPRAKGPALLTALRYGASQVVVEAGEGERDDVGGGGDDSSPGAGRRDRVPEHLRESTEDAEMAAADEQEQAERWRVMLAALEQVRLDNPEAAEVVRRRHGLDGGEPETYEEIAASGLACTGRRPCRESVRKMYVSATRRMEETAASPALPAVAAQPVATPAVTEETRPAPPAPSEAAMRALSVFRRRRAASSPVAADAIAVVREQSERASLQRPPVQDYPGVYLDCDVRPVL